MEKGDKGSTMIRMGVSGWMFLLVPTYPGCPGSKAVKRSLLLLYYIHTYEHLTTHTAVKHKAWIWGTGSRYVARWQWILIMRARAHTHTRACAHTHTHTHIHTHTHPFNGPLSGTTRVGWYQKGKTKSVFYWSYINDEQTDVFLDKIWTSWNCRDIGWTAITCSNRRCTVAKSTSVKLGWQCRQCQQVLATWPKGSSGLILLK